MSANDFPRGELQVKTVRNVSTPATLGAHVELSTGSVWQFAVIKGEDTTSIFFAMTTRASGGAWTSLSKVVEPERFGPMPTKWRELEAWVQAFFARSSD